MRGGAAGAFIGAAAAAHRARRCARARALGAKLLEAIFGVVLHALELHLQLLVVVLQLLDRAGELAQRILHAVDAHGPIAGVGLRSARAALRLALALLRRRSPRLNRLSRNPPEERCSCAVAAPASSTESATSAAMRSEREHVMMN